MTASPPTAARVSAIANGVLSGHTLIMGPLGSRRMEYARQGLALAGYRDVETIMGNTLLSMADLAGSPTLGSDGLLVWEKGALARAMVEGRPVIIADFDLLLGDAADLVADVLRSGFIRFDPETGRPTIPAQPGFRIVATASGARPGVALAFRGAVVDISI
jgi:hypothetical protein